MLGRGSYESLHARYTRACSTRQKQLPRSLRSKRVSPTRTRRAIPAETSLSLGRIGTAADQIVQIQVIASGQSERMLSSDLSGGGGEGSKTHEKRRVTERGDWGQLSGREGESPRRRDRTQNTGQKIRGRLKRRQRPLIFAVESKVKMTSLTRKRKGRGKGGEGWWRVHTQPRGTHSGNREKKEKEMNVGRGRAEPQRFSLSCSSLTRGGSSGP